MRLLIQRVLEANVSVAGKTVSTIGRGMLVLLGINQKDDYKIAEKLALKLLKIRLWDELISNENKQINEIEETKEDSNNSKEPKSWNSNILENKFEILIVSQFTLYGFFKGNKPDFHNSMNADEARKIYEYFVDVLQKNYEVEKIKKGAFQEYMQVGLVNDGPVTLILEEEKQNEDENKKKIKK